MKLVQRKVIFRDLEEFNGFFFMLFESLDLVIIEYLKKILLLFKGQFALGFYLQLSESWLIQREVVGIDWIEEICEGDGSMEVQSRREGKFYKGRIFVC